MADRTRTRPYKTSAPPSGGQRLITAQQVTHAYGIPHGTLRDMVAAGDLKRVRLGTGRRWWFDRRDLDRLIEASKETAA